MLAYQIYQESIEQQQPTDPIADLRYNTVYCSSLNDNYWNQVLSVEGQVDSNGDFVISRDELNNFFLANGIQQDVDAAIAEVDYDANNNVDLWELCYSAYQDQSSQSSSDSLPEPVVTLPSYDDYQAVAANDCQYFQSWVSSYGGQLTWIYDTNGDYVVSYDEFRTNNYRSEEEIQQFLASADTNQDGYLTTYEFCDSLGNPFIPVVDETYGYADVNGTLALACPEYSDDVRTAAIQHFAPLDSNRDGVVEW